MNIGSLLGGKLKLWHIVAPLILSLLPECARIDEQAALGNSRGVQQILKRVNGDRSANYVYITPEPGGGMMGYALHLFADGDMKYAKFLSFEVAIERGNNYVINEAIPLRFASEATDEDTERNDAVAAEGATASNEYTQENVRAVVVQNQLPLTTGYHVDVYVDNQFVVTVFKDCNGGTLFGQATAQARAQSFLPLLQGWAHSW